MPDDFLYKELDTLVKYDKIPLEVPEYIIDNLNPILKLRPYQTETFARFIFCLHNEYTGKELPHHFLFNMATGSGKTLIMAGIILYLFQQGYRNFLFFVNSTQIIEKTKENFLNPSSSKYLFNEKITFENRIVNVNRVENFDGVNQNEINICFTTIHQLHNDCNSEREDTITFRDFIDKKIILIADEAHHINVSTKRQNDIESDSWEDTVNKIFQQNKENFLLEYTATIDYEHPNVSAKYLNKAIFRYDLRQFRNERYSKDVYIIQSDFNERERIIQAIILSQYKQSVAAKYRINLKPVILFKAQRTIAQSLENEENFYNLIENLKLADIEEIQKKSKIGIVQRAFQFFADNEISLEQLVERLKREFIENRCISVNKDNEKKNYQILLNSLEDRNNLIRAVFAVEKLNEGWDVLNLFDIVRCYEQRDGKAGRPGKTTMKEAQLIGRGARYYPFVTENHSEKFKRKFDNDLTNDLRVLEDLHYHSINDSRYISEIRTALIEEGMLDESQVVKELKLKDDFKNTDFFNRGIIYLNERVVNNCEHVDSFEDLGVSKKNFVFHISSGRGSSGRLLSNEKIKEVKEPKRKDIALNSIETHIIRNALARDPFYYFSNLRKYFPNIQTSNDFINGKEFLGGLTLTFEGSKGDLSNLPNWAKFYSLSGLLTEIKGELKKNKTEYRGTPDFKPNSVSQIFFDKLLKLNKDSERCDGDESFVTDKDWYVFNANYGTSEEKAFVRMLDRQIDTLRQKYHGIYLIRNERHLQIFNFNDGRPFEPDYILFLKLKNGQILTYQIFIEPKGKHLKEHEKWKEDFLSEITEKYGSNNIITFNKKNKYKIIGVPFYNNEDENEFKESLLTSVEISE